MTTNLYSTATTFGRRLAMVAMVGIILGAASAAAQKKTRAAGAEEARKAYARGTSLYDAGQYEAAELQFQKAYSLSPNPIVLLSIAKTQQKRGDFRGAVETLELYLKERKNAPDRADVQKQIDEIKEKPAQLTVESEPTGARVWVDGTPRPGLTPMEIEIEPGMHELEIRYDGYVPVEQQVEVEFAEQRTLTVALTPVQAVAEPTPATAVADEQEKTDLTVPIWIATGVAAMGVVSGTILGILALSKQSDFNDNPTEETADNGERLALFADVSFGVAAAAGITALVLVLTNQDSDDEGEEQAHVTPELSPHYAGVSAKLAF